MFTQKGYCGMCRKLVHFLLWFTGGEGDKSRIKRQCPWCEETKEFLVERDAMSHLSDLHLDPLEQRIVDGCTDFYVLVRKCYHHGGVASILILDQQTVAGKIHIDGFCVECRQKQSFVITKETYAKQIHKLMLVGGGT